MVPSGMAAVYADWKSSFLSSSAPPSGLGISTHPASVSRSHSAVVFGSLANAASVSRFTVIPSTPALPLLPFTCRNAFYRFSRLHISSINPLVLAEMQSS